MAHARTAIANARDDGAGALAQQRLQTAEQKYSNGQAAMQKGDSESNQLAGRLFEEAEADAQLASASALAQKAQSAAAELQQKQQQEQTPSRNSRAM
jgi:ABC-type molybdate transport system substrate-binding protein